MSRTNLESLTHLEVALIGKVLDQLLHLDPTMIPRDELEDDTLQPILDEGGDFSRVRSRDFEDWIRLTDDEVGLDLSNEVLGISADRTSTKSKLVSVRMSTKEMRETDRTMRKSVS